MPLRGSRRTWLHTATRPRPAACRRAQPPSVLRMAIARDSVTAVDRVAAFPEALGEHHFHLDRLLVGHRIQMREELRYKPDAIRFDDACGFDTRLVIPESLFRRQTRHADVIARASIASRVAQVDDVNGMMVCSHAFDSPRINVVQLS